MQNSTFDIANRVIVRDDPFEDKRFLNFKPEHRETMHALFDDWVQDARQQAVAIKQHFEEAEGSAGTHAYDMLAAYAHADAQTTDMLIAMVAATVLSKLIQDEGGGRSNIEFSPADMDTMHRQYELEINRDGMLTSIKLKPRAEFLTSLKLSHDRDGDLEIVTDAKPQAEARDPEPYWFMRAHGERQPAANQKSANEMVRKSDDPAAQVENRRCPRHDCPAPAHIDCCLAGRCPNKRTEVTSTD